MPKFLKGMHPVEKLGHSKSKGSENDDKKVKGGMFAKMYLKAKGK